MPGTEFIDIGGKPIEVARFGAVPGAAPTLVFLHEGLGCVGMWRDFPGRLAQATGCGALVYSRFGYGRSAPCALPRPLGYMHDEAQQILPALLAAAGLQRVILVGHSDGASIALIHAGDRPWPGLQAVVALAPHVFCEDVSVRSIAAAAVAYREGRLKQRLARHHGANVECAFWGWNGAWLDPEFRRWNIEGFLPAIRVPLLVIQGEDDEYGTAAQVAAISRRLPAAATLMLARCGHAPQRDQPETTLAAVADFIRRARADGVG